MPDRSENTSDGPAPFPWVQFAALVVGAALFLYGLVGFWFTGFSPLPPTEQGPTLLGMELNPLRTTLYLVLGIVGLGCAAKRRTARVYGWVLAAVGLVSAAFGVVTLLVPGTDLLSMNVASTLASLALAAVGLLIALGRSRSAAPFDGLERAMTRGERRDEPGDREEGPAS
jgi:hypothetical protein